MNWLRFAIIPFVISIVNTETQTDTYDGFGTVVLLVPPSHKECHLHPNERPVGIPLQFFNDCCQNVLHTSMLYVIVFWVLEEYSALTERKRIPNITSFHYSY